MVGTLCRPSDPSSNCCRKDFLQKVTEQPTQQSLSASRAKGKPEFGRKHLDWGPKDIFVVPSGQPVVHEAGEETVLFSFSDRPVQEELALWREKLG